MVKRNSIKRVLRCKHQALQGGEWHLAEGFRTGGRPAATEILAACISLAIRNKQTFPVDEVGLFNRITNTIGVIIIQVAVIMAQYLRRPQRKRIKIKSIYPKQAILIARNNNINVNRN